MVIYFLLHISNVIQVHFYDHFNKAVSPDPFYRFIDDVVFTPFDFEAERAKIQVPETESNYYLSRCLKLTRQSNYHYARVMLSGIVRAEFEALSAEVTNDKFIAKIRNILNTIYFHMTASTNADEVALGQMQFER